MSLFNVWIRPLSSACRVRVDGMQNAKWLLNRLSESFVFKTADPMREDEESSCCTFHLACNSQMPRRGFERLLADIPEVNLMTDPA
jgi:hypothetical protein